jgi:hypothetical protein
LLRSTPVLSFGLWVADITYLPTWAGLLNLAIVLDALEPARDRPSRGIASPDAVPDMALANADPPRGAPPPFESHSRGIVMHRLSQR